ncbi:MAG: four helix bundle protein [Rickettsiales bacterium]|jgi:four helix bundle protein|nr:four helix bundle protein [Rickettsiales bacterium]
MGNVRDLKVYQAAFQIAIDIYKITEHFPKSEIFGLVSQMRRAAVSINSNLSEGSYRNSTSEYKHFVGIAKGSAGELRYQIEISMELGFISEKDGEELVKKIEEICKMLAGLSSALDKK